MTIKFACPNGHPLVVQESLAGKRGKCPQRAAPIMVPMPSAGPLADLPSPPESALREAARAKAAPISKSAIVVIAAAGGITFVLAFGIGAAILFLGNKPHQAGPNAIPAASPQAVASPPSAAPTAAPPSAAVPPASASSPETPVVVRLKEPAQAFAMNHETGDLAAVSANSAALYLYSPQYQEQGSGKVAGPVQAGTLPVTIAFKRYKDKSYFIVGDINESSLRLFNSETLALSGEIRLGTRHLIMVHSPRSPENPHVFYTGYKEGDRSPSAGRANLATMADEGFFADDSLEVEPGPRGDFLYVRRPGFPSSARVVTFGDAGDFAPKSLVQRHGRHESSHRVIADAYDKWVLAYNAAYQAGSLREGSEAGTFEFTPMCFVSNRSLVAGVTFEELVIASTRGLKPRTEAEAAEAQRRRVPSAVVPPAATVPLPPSLLPTPPKHVRGDEAERRRWLSHYLSQHPLGPKELRDQFRLFSSPQGDRLILVHRDALFSIALKSLGLADEPEVSATITAPAEVVLGSTWSAKVAANDGIAVTLAEAPKGMSLSGDLLTWTPAAQQVGQFTAWIDLAGGSRTEKQKIEIRVVRPHVACSFPTQRLEISHDGHWALAIGQQSPTANRVFDPLRKTSLAVVDLVNLKVVAEREVDFPVLLAAIDEHYAYVTTSPFRTRDCELLVLSREDLSELHGYPIEINRGTDASKEPAIASLAGKYLIADTVRSLPDLKPVHPEELQSHSALGRANLLALHRRLTDGWLFDGIVYDKDFEKIQLVSGYRDASSSMRLAGPVSGLSKHLYLSPWNLTWEGDDGRYTTTMFISDLGQIASDLPTEVPASARSGRQEARRILDDLPVLVTFGSDEKNPQTVVTAHCVGDSRRLGQWPVAPFPLQANKSDASTAHVAMAGRTAAVALAGMIYAFPLEGLDDQPLKEPPHFVPRQSQFVLATRGNSQLQYTIRGGTPPYRQFTERGQPDRAQPEPGGFTSADGSVDIELNWQDLLRPTKEEFVRLILEEGRRRLAARQSGATARQKGARADRVTALDVLDDYRRQVTQLLRQAGAEPPAGVPIPYRVGLYAQDAEGKPFGLAHWVFGEIALEEMRSAVGPDSN